MGHDHDHRGILSAATAQVQALYDGSAQAMYLYLDDDAKSCNRRFASLLGYKSPEEWAAVKGPFPTAFVADESQEDLVEAFQSAMNGGMASVVPVVWKRRDGKKVETDVILAPFDHAGHRMALHFIETVE